MSLAGLLKEGSPKGNGVDKVLVAYSTLSDDEAEAFRSLIADPLWSNPQIAAALREMGHDIHEGQVKNLRAKLRSGKVAL